jgi:hypothetical protein
VTEEFDVGTIREESLMQAGFLCEDIQDQNRGQKAEKVDSGEHHVTFP